MLLKVLKRSLILVSAWLPFFALWVLFAMSFSRERFSLIFLASLISMGSAGLLGIAVWHVCKRWPWPLGFNFRFYVIHIFLAFVYAAAWTIAVYVLDLLRRGSVAPGFWTWPIIIRQLLIGFWFYAIFAGLSYAAQTRSRLQEKEIVAARAEALAVAARLDAVRARLNPHFLFNALHTLAALVKFRPAAAESAIERLGDMLRYALKEDGREVVEFSEEYDFTRQYLAFEQLRYEDRLKVDIQVDPESFHFDILPFAMQTLVENAVRHAISIRPEGGSISITCSCANGRLQVTVRDNGPGNGLDASDSHQFGLRSVRERLRAAYGDAAELRIQSHVDGFEASFTVPSYEESPVAKQPALREIR
jgi:signal transduction histidine kinase